MNRQKVTSWIKKLNAYYGLNVCLRMPNTSAKASADIFGGCIRLAKLSPLYDERVIAHEYAHFLQCNRQGTIPQLEQEHDQHFESIYQGCCQVLDVPATPTRTLRRLKRAEVRALKKKK